MRARAVRQVPAARSPLRRRSRWNVSRLPRLLNHHINGQTHIHAVAAPALSEFSNQQPARISVRLTAAWECAVDSFTIRPDESQCAVIENLDIESILVNRTMMKSAQRNEVGRLGLTTICPVFDVVHVDEASIAAAGETATLVACSE